MTKKLKAKLNVAAYCRVSTDTEDQRHSLTAQIKYFTEYISGHSEWKLKEVYFDEGITGTSVKKREGFNRMIADAEQGKVDLILTKEVSRFARNTIDTLTYTRKLSSIGVGVIFTNDNIDTRDKDGELRLTIMASIAQEESRKVSERVKWGIRRKMEDGWVYGQSAMLGFRIENGKLTIIPDEAEVVRKIFNSYVYDKKGCHTIANELNAAGLLTVRGKMWREDGVIRILKNDKYVGDLTQWKHYSTDFLSKKVVQNDGDNPDVPLITIQDHHEPIISREVWNSAQRQIEERGRMSREGRKHSQSYWYSSKVFCGKCDYTFNVSGRSDKTKRTLQCVNRRKYGSTPRVDANGAEVGCDNHGINETVLAFFMGYILRQLQGTREFIVKDLLEEIQTMQRTEKPRDTKPLEDEIEKIIEKKRKVFDMALDEIITKEDLESQMNFFNSEIARLTEEINSSQNQVSEHQSQIDKIKGCITEINKTADINADDTDCYGELLERFIIYSKNKVDVYLTAVPFGFRFEFQVKKFNQQRRLNVIVDSFDAID